MNKLLILGTLGLLTMTMAVVAAPTASASGGWDCTGDPTVVEVCTAKELWWPADCFLYYTVLSNPSPEFCYSF